LSYEFGLLQKSEGFWLQQHHRVIRADAGWVAAVDFVRDAPT
jgi:hypothetical protein